MRFVAFSLFINFIVHSNIDVIDIEHRSKEVLQWFDYKHGGPPSGFLVDVVFVGEGRVGHLVDPLQVELGSLFIGGLETVVALANLFLCRLADDNLRSIFNERLLHCHPIHS